MLAPQTLKYLLASILNSFLYPFLNPCAEENILQVLDTYFLTADFLSHPVQQSAMKPYQFNNISCCYVSPPPLLLCRSHTSSSRHLKAFSNPAPLSFSQLMVPYLNPSLSFPPNCWLSDDTNLCYIHCSSHAPADIMILCFHLPLPTGQTFSTCVIEDNMHVSRFMEEVVPLRSLLKHLVLG